MRKSIIGHEHHPIRCLLASRMEFPVRTMGKILFALAVVAALGFGSLCITGSAAATPLRSPDALPVAAARADLADRVVMVCRTKRVCGPNGPLPHGAVLRATALPLGGPGFGHRYWRR